MVKLYEGRTEAESERIERAIEALGKRRATLEAMRGRTGKYRPHPLEEAEAETELRIACIDFERAAEREPDFAQIAAHIERVGR